jgi:LmbE family N-acetylglucosaminyl deacetylase
MKKVLIIAAHPDDEILGCAGTVLKRIAQGDEVYSLVLGEGITSRCDTRELADMADLAQLRDSCSKASEYIGFKKHWQHDFPDNRFDSIDLLDVIKVIERVKDEIKPNVIYTHFENDLNIDHRVVFQAVLTACRPVIGETVKEIYSFEIPSSTEWVSPFNGANCFRPNVFTDITDTIDKKIEALRLYETEVKEYPHPRSPEALRIIAQRWGVMCGLKFAEPLILIRGIK